jgi:hypothetical protein
MKHNLFLAATLALAAALPAQAVTLAADGQWSSFDVDELSAASGGLEWIDLFAEGVPLSFSFTIAAGSYGTLTVVDGGFAGDSFSVTSNGNPLGQTSAGVDSAPDSIGLDFDAALADARYSRGSWQFGAGTWTVGGALAASALYDGLPLNATVGAVRLEVSPVPEPAAAGLLLAGLGLLAAARRSTR